MLTRQKYQSRSTYSCTNAHSVLCYQSLCFVRGVRCQCLVKARKCTGSRSTRRQRINDPQAPHRAIFRKAALAIHNTPQAAHVCHDGTRPATANVVFAGELDLKRLATLHASCSNLRVLSQSRLNSTCSKRNRGRGPS